MHKIIYQKGCAAMKCQDTYGEPTIMRFPNMTVEVYRPVLSEEERARRMEILHDAAADLLISAEKANGKWKIEN